MLRQMLRGGNAVLSGNDWVEEQMRATLGSREVLRALLRWMLPIWVAVEKTWGILRHFGALPAGMTNAQEPMTSE
jgi:hypothetical protein